MGRSFRRPHLDHLAGGRHFRGHLALAAYRQEIANRQKQRPLKKAFVFGSIYLCMNPVVENGIGVLKIFKIAK